MNTVKFLQKNSIATQLIKIVFALYCVVAIIVTLGQIILEYRHTKNQIQQELSINKAIFEPVLSAGLWNLDDEQIQNTINGMLAIPIITGIKIEQNQQLHTAVGHIKDQFNTTKHYSNKGEVSQLKLNDSSELFSYSFDISYQFRDKKTLVGRATIYSDSSTVIDRVGLGLVLLVINSIIKTIALWLLFFYVGKKILLQPLNNLIDAIKSVNFNTLDEFKVDLKSQHDNELTVIQVSFARMITHLLTAKNKIIDLNDNLEAKVERRTLDLKVAKEDAELANNAKATFLTRINHELRTPLNAILGCSQILQQMLNQPDNQKQLNLLNHNIDAAEHLLMLIEDIMDMVVLNKTQVNMPLENCHLSEIFYSAVHMVHRQAKDRNVTITVEPTCLTAFANSGRLKQVLINLLTNAIKFNHLDGTVQLSAKTLDAEHLVINVKDSGIGIASSDLSVIFEPLNRLAYAEENCICGIGIGLSIANDLIKQMNGTIIVTSDIDQGCEFTITLPLEK